MKWTIKLLTFFGILVTSLSAFSAVELDLWEYSPRAAARAQAVKVRDLIQRYNQEGDVVVVSKSCGPVRMYQDTYMREFLFWGKVVKVTDIWDEVKCNPNRDYRLSYFFDRAVSQLAEAARVADLPSIGTFESWNHYLNHILGTEEFLGKGLTTEDDKPSRVQGQGVMLDGAGGKYNY